MSYFLYYCALRSDPDEENSDIFSSPETCWATFIAEMKAIAENENSLKVKSIDLVFFYLFGSFVSLSHLGLTVKPSFFNRIYHALFLNSLQ